MFIFFIITLTLFSLIVINSKKYDIVLPKIDNKLNNYVNNAYKENKNNFYISKTIYNKENNNYLKKMTSKENKHLYFYVIYKNKKISNTYQEDYIKGKTLFNYLTTKYQKQLNKKNMNTKITFTKDLNQYTSTIKEKIISNKSKYLPIYNISTELNTSKFTVENISKIINNFYKLAKKYNYNPKYYNITINNNTDILKSFKISNLNNDLISNNIIDIINGIMNNDKSIITKYNIDYQYIN